MAETTIVRENAKLASVHRTYSKARREINFEARSSSLAKAALTRTALIDI